MGGHHLEDQREHPVLVRCRSSTTRGGSETLRGSKADAGMELLYLLHPEGTLPLVHMLAGHVRLIICAQESVASSLEGMNLYEDALQQYYELESTFFQVLREKNLSWFGALITPMPTDDSTPLLSITKKPYRDLILANTISVFDFRVYLLARQCILLSKIGDMEELCRKATSFLSTFSRTLRDVEVSATLHR